MTPEDRYIWGLVTNRFVAAWHPVMELWKPPHTMAGVASTLALTSGTQDARDALVMCAAQDERSQYAGAILIDVNPFFDCDIDAGGEQTDALTPEDFLPLYDPEAT